MEHRIEEIRQHNAPGIVPDLLHAAWLGLFVFALQVLYWAVRIRSAYSPAGDEFSLLAHSAWFFHPQPLEWFRYGFSGYFSPYPDKSLPRSDFIRPMVNVTYFVQSVLFGRHWSMYLIGNYIIEGAVVAALWLLARGCFGLRKRLALLVTIASALSPAYNYLVVFRPSFAFDLLGGLFALLTLTLLLQSRWIAAWLLVWCAIFTKESVYFVAPAACVAVILLRAKLPLMRRLLSATLYLVPLACTALLRRLDFPSGAVVYVLRQASGSSPARRLLPGFMHWPYLFPGPMHGFTIFLTVVVWCLVCVAVFVSLRRQEAESNAGSVPSRQVALQVLLVFLFGSLLLPIGLDLGNRFGGSAYPLLFLMLGALAQRAFSFSGTWKPAVQWVAAGMLVVATIADGEVLASSLFRGAFRKEQLVWARSRSLLAVLAQERRPVVFLVADGTEAFSSPENLERVSGYRGSIVPVSNLDLDLCHEGMLSVQQATAGAWSVHSAVPAACGSNSMGAAYFVTAAPLHTFVRDLPQATLTYYAHEGGWSDGQFSTGELDILVEPKIAEYALLVPKAQDSPEIRDITRGQSR